MIAVQIIIIIAINNYANMKSKAATGVEATFMFLKFVIVAEHYYGEA